MTKKIAITKGKYALVDDEDFERINKYSWCLQSDGYAERRKTVAPGKNKIVYMHREILKTPKGMFTDHINGDRLDNRKENLRICDAYQNSHNSKMLNTNTSGYRGVSWEKRFKKWASYIYIKNKHTFLGYFDNKIDAAKAYDEQAKKHRGKFARLNFPESAT